MVDKIFKTWLYNEILDNSGGEPMPLARVIKK